MLKLQANDGFVLFEVMLSLAILCLGLILILSSFKVGISAVKASKDYTQAMFLLQQKIGELETTANELYPGKIEGGFEDNHEFTWKAEIKKLDDIELKEVKVIVEWKEGKVDLVTYL
jgi:type II secretion system protein I